MNSFRNGLYFLSALILLVCIGVIVWYALIDSQRPNVEEGGTLAAGWQVRQMAEVQDAGRYMAPWLIMARERQVTL